MPQLNAEHFKVLNNMVFPEAHDPFVFKLCWLKASNTFVRSEDRWCRQHHHRFYEVHFFLEGESSYAVEENGKRDIFKIERNQFIVFPPNISHEKLKGGQGYVSFSLAYEIPPQENPLAEYFCCPRPFVGLIAPDMRDMFTGIASELDFQSELTPIILRNSVFNIIYRICRQASSSPRQCRFSQQPRSIDQRVRSSMRFIDDNIDLPLTANMVAEYAHISYKQLNRLFVSELNTTVLRYIHERKNKKAKGLLIEGELSLAQVSRAVGFENEYYFNSFFKKMNGISPGAFRKEH